eukprot:2700217-Prymnesium_polylepis.2
MVNEIMRGVKTIHSARAKSATLLGASPPTWRAGPATRVAQSSHAYTRHDLVLRIQHTAHRYTVRYTRAHPLPRSRAANLSRAPEGTQPDTTRT